MGHGLDLIRAMKLHDELSEICAERFDGDDENLSAACLALSAETAIAAGVTLASFLVGAREGYLAVLERIEEDRKTSS